MEVDLIAKIFSEWGLVYGLFFIIVWWFVWKGVPYMAGKF